MLLLLSISYFILFSTAVTKQHSFVISIKESHNWLTIVKARTNIVMEY